LIQLFTNAHVFAPEDLGVCHLLIGGGRILGISANRDSLFAAAATEIDLRGKRLLPGFIDGHAHLTGGGGESGFSSRVPPVSLGMFTRAGVTTVVGVLGTDDTTRDTRSLVAQTRALREEGLGAFCHTAGYHIPPVTLTGCVKDDIVFIDPVIGAGEVAISDHRSSQPTLNEIMRLASDVHVAGLITGKAGILHLHLGDGDRGLDLVRRALDTSELPARVFNPTHINRKKALFEEAIELARRGCTVDITAFPVDDDDDAWAPNVALLRYLESGAPANRITMSSDGGGCLPVFNEQGEIVEMDIGRPSLLMSTLQSLLDQGIPMEKVLPAFTSNVADILRFADRGRVRDGACADFIILDNQNAISDVVIAGIFHIQSGEQQVFGQFEKAVAGRH
jgi:beta-aspartyl-dipeptidase (metallo-type)